MTEDEKYVREHFEDSRMLESRKFGARILANGNRVLGTSWSAAAEFTRSRLEQIRDVEEEIQLLAVFQMAVSQDSPNWLTMQRIHTRETEALEALRRGMK